MVAAYLQRARVPWVQAGFSTCRICGKPNGCAELTDGTYLWPEGLAHYVEDHAVRLPREIVEHVLQRQINPDGVDDSWWKSVHPSDSGI